MREDINFKGANRESDFWLISELCHLFYLNYRTILKSANSSLLIVLSLVNSHFVIRDLGLPVVDNHSFLKRKTKSAKNFFDINSWKQNSANIGTVS